jgi:hypothetical protein
MEDIKVIRKTLTDLGYQMISSQQPTHFSIIKGYEIWVHDNKLKVPICVEVFTNGNGNIFKENTLQEFIINH